MGSNPAERAIFLTDSSRSLFRSAAKSPKTDAVLNVLLTLLLWVAQEPANSGTGTHGVMAKFTQGGATDLLIVPNLALFVAPTNPPSMFLQPGQFASELSGYVSVEIRAQYTFRALVKGHLDLLVNGNSILSFSGTGDLSEPSKPVRLNRGTNSIVARFTAPESEDAQFQIFWRPKNCAVPIPIPTELLSYVETTELKNSAELHRGFNLFAEYRCGRCHASGEQIAAELDFGAPDFENIGNRLNGKWMTDWIAKPTAHMPKLFSAAEASDKIAAYLSTLKSAEPDTSSGDKTRGEELFKSLNCAVCHDDANRSLSALQKKFRAGSIVQYLENPQAHYRWNPMPNFKLTREEALNLAAFLTQNASAEDNDRPAAIGEGARLVQSSGCLNCHNSKLENQYTAPPLTAVSKSGLSGCLSTNDIASAPRFNLSPEEKTALAAFLRNGNFTALHNPTPSELALRHVETLHCAECHERIEGAPRVATLGAKLKPEWAKRFIAGEVNYKPRPWMPQRMPAFPAHATTLAIGLAALHGNPSQSPSEPAVNSPLAATGAKLVSAAGGFSCVACHAVGAFTSGQVVETPGVNLAHSSERLLKSYFQRWVMNPVVLEPATKMPVYFDAQGRSQLTDILDGDGEKQINAIREYVRLGEKMPPPPTPQP